MVAGSSKADRRRTSLSLRKGRVAASAGPTAVAASPSTRELLLEAGLKAFAKQGFEGVSLSGVARGAGVAQPLIHHYFGSKRGLWEAAVDLAFRGVGEAFREAPTELRGLDAIATMKVLLRRFVLVSARRPEMHLILAREAALNGERLDWLIDRHVAPLQRALNHLITNAQAEGRIKRIPVPQLGQILIGAVAVFLCSSPLMERLYGIDSLAPEEVGAHADAVAEVLLHGIEAGVGDKE